MQFWVWKEFAENSGVKEMSWIFISLGANLRGWLQTQVAYTLWAGCKSAPAQRLSNRLLRGVPELMSTISLPMSLDIVQFSLRTDAV